MIMLAILPRMLKFQTKYAIETIGPMGQPTPKSTPSPVQFMQLGLYVQMR